MHLTFKTRRRIQRVATVALIVLLIVILVAFCWNIWVARYVVYTRDGATLDFSREPLPEINEFVSSGQSEVLETVPIFYNEGSDSVDLSQELTALNGYYIDYDMLKGTSMDEIKADLNQL